MSGTNIHAPLHVRITGEPDCVDEGRWNICVGHICEMVGFLVYFHRGRNQKLLYWEWKGQRSEGTRLPIGCIAAISVDFRARAARTSAEQQGELFVDDD
jgi:hypothetical protein